MNRAVRVLHQPDIAALLRRCPRLPTALQPAGRPRPPQARIGRPKQRDRRRACRGRQMRHRRIGPDKDARAPAAGPRAGARRATHPSNAAARSAQTPYRDSALVAAGPPGGDHVKPARSERCRQRAPAFVRPALVAKHRRRMDHRIGLMPEQCLRRRTCGAHDFSHPRDAQRIGEPQHLLDPMQYRDETGTPVVSTARLNALIAPWPRLARHSYVPRGRQTASADRRSGSRPRGHSAAPSCAASARLCAKRRALPAS